MAFSDVPLERQRFRVGFTELLPRPSPTDAVGWLATFASSSPMAPKEDAGGGPGGGR